MVSQAYWRTLIRQSSQVTLIDRRAGQHAFRFLNLSSQLRMRRHVDVLRMCREAVTNSGEVFYNFGHGRRHVGEVSVQVRDFASTQGPAEIASLQEILEPWIVARGEM